MQPAVCSLLPAPDLYSLVHTLYKMQHGLETISDTPSLMDRLPNELLAFIRRSMDEFDLVFHVRFYLTSRGTKVLYDEDNTFWYRLCRINRIGSLPHDRRDRDEQYWFAVALECETHAQTCTHPVCGLTLLTANSMNTSSCNFLIS